MQFGVSRARQMRAQHRHELHSLIYLTLDDANGGIIRNLNHSGIAVQAVTSVRPGQKMQVRFELRGPRVMVALRGEVMWGTDFGQCGIRFIDVPPRTTRQIDEWILGSLLAGSSVRTATDAAEDAAATGADDEEDEDDGLTVSASPVRVIQLPLRLQRATASYAGAAARRSRESRVELDWLSEPLSGRGMVWAINALAFLAALLLFGFVFLSITQEPPPRPWAMCSAVTALVGGLFWGFFSLFGGSPGARLVRLIESGGQNDEEERAARFR
jgi:PilZ domain